MWEDFGYQHVNVDVLLCVLLVRTRTTYLFCSVVWLLNPTSCIPWANWKSLLCVWTLYSNVCYPVNIIHCIVYPLKDDLTLPSSSRATSTICPLGPSHHVCGSKGCLAKLTSSLQNLCVSYEYMCIVFIIFVFIFDRYAIFYLYEVNNMIEFTMSVGH